MGPQGSISLVFLFQHLEGNETLSSHEACLIAPQGSVGLVGRKRAPNSLSHILINKHTSTEAIFYWSFHCGYTVVSRIIANTKTNRLYFVVIMVTVLVDPKSRLTGGGLRCGGSQTVEHVAPPRLDLPPHCLCLNLVWKPTDSPMHSQTMYESCQSVHLFFVVLVSFILWFYCLLSIDVLHYGQPCCYKCAVDIQLDWIIMYK